ncbi:MAG TPA: FeoB-associated Cys-rich membrane protein [Desulfomonilia bacterium]
MELLIISLIVGIAAAYLAATLYRRIRKPSCSCRCENCPLDEQQICSGKNKDLK